MVRHLRFEPGTLADFYTTKDVSITADNDATIYYTKDDTQYLSETAAATTKTILPAPDSRSRLPGNNIPARLHTPPALCALSGKPFLIGSLRSLGPNLEEELLTR